MTDIDRIIVALPRFTLVTPQPRMYACCLCLSRLSRHGFSLKFPALELGEIPRTGRCNEHGPAQSCSPYATQYSLCRQKVCILLQIGREEQVRKRAVLIQRIMNSCFNLRIRVPTTAAVTGPVWNPILIFTYPLEESSSSTRHLLAACDAGKCRLKIMVVSG